MITAVPGPLGDWTTMRDLYPVAQQTFREWWSERSENKEQRIENKP
jgi:L-lactate dehydrogenase complex protein LldF